MTSEKFTEKCREITWNEPSQIALANGDVVMGCQMKGIRAQPKFHVFHDGVVAKQISKAAIFARLENDRCIAFGTVRDRDDYVNCRMDLAILRSQDKTLARALRQPDQQNGLALMNYGDTLRDMKHLKPVAIAAKCNTRRVAGLLSYNCK
jgi:hypothetical protein